MNATDPSDGHIAGAGHWAISLALLAAAASAVSWRASLAWQGADLFSDDAYYYAVIARNFVESGRITFDGTSLTSGFHPLMFWVEVAAMAIFGTDASPRGQYLGILASVITVFLLTIAGCLLATHRRAANEDDAVMQCSLLIAVCVILVPRFTTPYLGGMEAVLVLPLLILLAGLAWKARYAVAAVAALFLTMARLDTLPYVVFPVAAACAWRERGRCGPAIRSGLLVALPAVIGTAVFMLCNRWYFGHPMPIHGVLKSCFPRVNLQWHQVFDPFSDSTTPMLAFLTATAAAVLLLRSGKIGKDVRTAGLTAAALALIQLAAFVLFQKWIKPIPAWYVGPAMLTAAFALAVAIANVVGLRPVRTLTAAAVVIVLAINLVSSGKVLSHGPPAAGDGVGAGDSLIDFIKTQPSDRIWACTDCGKLAFWGRRSVVNLDGLVNDFRYQDALRDKRLGRYLLERNVKYLVFLVWDRPQSEAGRYEPMYECRVAPELFSGEYQTAEFYVYSYKYMNYSDRIRLPRTAEVWRSPASRDNRAMGRAVVFDLELVRFARP